MQQRTEYTKTDGSQREIPMLPAVYSPLLEQRRGTHIEVLHHAITTDAHRPTRDRRTLLVLFRQIKAKVDIPAAIPA